MTALYRSVLIALLVGAPLVIPIEAEARAGSPGDRARSHLLGYPLKSALRFFRWGISPVDGHRCPMAPSCSNFASDAIQEFGALRGAMLAADRLHRCGHDLYLYPSVQSGSSVHWVDSAWSYASAGDATERQPVALANKKIDFLLFLEQTAGVDLALLESFRLIHGHISGISPCIGFDRLVLETGARILNASGLHLDPLQYYELSQEWGILPASEAELRLISCRSLIRQGRWMESKSMLGEAPFPLLNQDSMSHWHFLKASANLHQREWRDASTHYFEWQSEHDLEIDFSKLALEGFSVPLKNPRLAGILSIIPGLGYAYAGHKQTAIAALLVVGITLGGVFEAVERDNTSLAVGSGLLCAGWYSGSIIGAIESTHRRNDYEIDRFRAQFPKVE